MAENTERTNNKMLVCMAIVCIALSACGGESAPNATIVALAVDATLTASAPTATPRPTDTPVPTNTPMASPTDVPTSTPTDTNTATPTPSATSTPAPTSTLTPTSIAGMTLELSLPSSLYEGPGSDYKKLGLLRTGHTVTLLARTESGRWLQVQSEPGRGWINCLSPGLSRNALATLPVLEVMAPTATPEEPVTLPPQIAKDANLRAGPGTNYAIIAAAKAGDTVDLLGRNVAGDWLLVESAGESAWVALFLVDVSDADIGALPVEQSAAPTVTPVPQEPIPPTAFPGIGEEVEGGGWRFKVSEVHKRKAVYFYSRSYIAHGNFLVVVIDAVNLQSGTDYFYRNMKPWLVDAYSKVYSYSSKGSGYAEWQFGGLSSVFTDVNPGNLARIAIAFDIPEGTGQVLLSTEALIWIDLGDFSAMLLEE